VDEFIEKSKWVGESFEALAINFGSVEGLMMRRNLNLEAFTSDPGRLSKHALF